MHVKRRLKGKILMWKIDDQQLLHQLFRMFLGNENSEFFTIYIPSMAKKWGAGKAFNLRMSSETVKLKGQLNLKGWSVSGSWANLTSSFYIQFGQQQHFFFVLISPAIRCNEHSSTLSIFSFIIIVLSMIQVRDWRVSISSNHDGGNRKGNSNLSYVYSRPAFLVPCLVPGSADWLRKVTRGKLEVKWMISDCCCSQVSY